MNPYDVLDVWKWGPKGRYASKIGLALTDLTASLGLTPFVNNEIKRNTKAAWFDYDLHAELRLTTIPHSEGTSWHQDGDTSTDNMNCALVMWSNTTPTQFKVDDEIFQPKPFEVILARNLDCYHRRPPNAQGKRFLFRQRVEC